MKKWEKIEKAFEGCKSEAEAVAKSKEIDSDTVFIFVEGPDPEGMIHAAGGANRLYQRTMVSGWNKRNGKPSGSRKMRVFI